MRVLVTGASGNVGKYVVTELLKRNQRVLVAGTDTERLNHMFGERVQVVKFNFLDPSTFELALTDVDRVFLMRPPHLGKPDDLYPFILAAKEKNIALMSFLSLMGVENNTIPPHHKIEKAIEKAGIPYAHIRPGFFMQNVSGIHAEEIKQLDEIWIPAGRSKTSFIDAEDIGTVIATVLADASMHKNTAYTITGPEALDYDEVAQILSKVTGRSIRYKNPSFLKYRSHYVKVRKLDKGYVNVTLALYLMTRLGTAKAVTDTFFKLTGKQPKTFENFVADHKTCFIK